MALSTTFASLRRTPNKKPISSRLLIKGYLAGRLTKSRSGLLTKNACPDYMQVLFPEKSQKQNTKLPEISQEILEAQLHNEFRKEVDTSMLRKRRHKSGDNITIHKLIKAHEPLEAIDFWERQRDESSRLTSHYMQKKLEEIESRLNTSMEKLVKEDWVLKNPILRQPIQILEDIAQKQRNVPTPSLVKSMSKKRIRLPALSLSAANSPQRRRESTKNFGPPPSTFKVINENDRQIALNGEIRLEMISQMLQKVAISKKQKLADLVAKNTELLSKIQKVDEELRGIMETATKKSSQLFTTQKLNAQQLNQVNMEKYKREIECNQKKAKKAALRKELHSNLEKIEQLKAKLGDIKKEVNSIKGKQLDYYTAHLSDGTEVRQEGLIWILKAIWFLGFNVPLSRMPKFLDQQAIEYLFKAILFS